MTGFVTFHVLRSANGFEPGWYYRLVDSLHNEPDGPYTTRQAAEAAASVLACVRDGRRRLMTVSDRVLALLRSRVNKPVNLVRHAAEVGIRVEYPENVIKVHVHHARRGLQPNERIISTYGRHVRGHRGTYTLIHV
jgi:hypothetical protein